MYYSSLNRSDQIDQGQQGWDQSLESLVQTMPTMNLKCQFAKEKHEIAVSTGAKLGDLFTAIEGVTGVVIECIEDVLDPHAPYTHLELLFLWFCLLST